MTQSETWRRCSACKKPIALGATYYVCSVSTCNRPRTGLVFCDVSCWEVHLPVARHREAWAEEQTAPRTAEGAPFPAPVRVPATGTGKPENEKTTTPAVRPAKRSIIRKADSRPSPAKDDLPQEVLIVASRLKDYVRARSGMNTSDRVLEPLSEIIRAVCDEAIRNAEQDGRKTVLDRDLPRRR